MKLTKEELYRLYWEEGLSTWKIGYRFNISSWEVHDLMKEYGIPRRSRRDAALGERIRRTCPVCGEEFEVTPGNFRWGMGKYCSKECCDSSKTKRKVFRCLNCGKKFKALPSMRKYGKGQFCSSECQYTYRRKGEERHCVVCGETFYAPLNKIQRGEGLYCSAECRNRDDSLKRRRLSKVHRNSNRRPTEPEQKMIDLLADAKLPYKYVGDGQVVLNGYNPDFINTNGKKKLIEVFGDYYHVKKTHTWRDSELGRIMTFNSLGFDCLVIWEHELKNDPDGVLAKIKKWDRKKSKKRG